VPRIMFAGRYLVKLQIIARLALNPGRKPAPRPRNEVVPKRFFGWPVLPALRSRLPISALAAEVHSGNSHESLQTPRLSGVVPKSRVFRNPAHSSS